MRRGIGRLRAGGSGFSPSQISFTSGLWLDQSDITTAFQDSAGTTPVTASAQQVGKRLDKSGLGNHVLQASATARPEYDLISSIASDFTDGVNDGYSTATFVAGTLTSNMDCFVAIKRDSAGQMVPISQVPTDGAVFFGVVKSADAGTATGTNCGAVWSYFVNGTQVGTVNSTTRGQLDTAVGNGSWCVLEVRNLDLSTWTQFTMGLYTTFMLNADIGGVILCPAQSTASRNNIRKWLGAKVGLSL